MYKICKRCLTCNTQHCSGGRGVNLNYISSPKTRSVPNVFTRIVCMRKIYMRIIREREKRKQEKNRHEWRSVCSWKNNINNYTYWKKKKWKKKSTANQIKKNTKIVVYHIVAITATKQINILLSCLKIYAHWNFFHVLQDSFKVPLFMEQGQEVKTPANYIHAYNESRFF